MLLPTMDQLTLTTVLLLDLKVKLVLLVVKVYKELKVLKVHKVLLVQLDLKA